MKKIIATAVLATILSLNANCQLDKGNWLVGGNFSFSNTKYNSDFTSKVTVYDIQINPNIGYFITDKLAVGIRGAISLNGNNILGPGIYSKYNNFNYGLFARYYLLSKEKLVNVICQGSYQFGKEGAENQFTNKSGYSIGTGAVAYFNSSIGVEFLINYNSFKYVDYDGRNNALQISIGLQVHLKK